MPRSCLIFRELVADPDRRDAYWGASVAAAFGPHAFKREHAIDAQLEKLKIKPKDVRYVLYSHLHLDHAGGMSYFPDAIHVIQRDEIRYAMWPDPWNSPVYCQNDFRDIRKLNILEIDGDFDLFEDGTLRLLKTPGHTPGHQVLIVNLPNRGRICMAADTGHQRGGFDNLVPMPWDWSTSAMSPHDLVARVPGSFPPRERQSDHHTERGRRTDPRPTRAASEQRPLARRDGTPNGCGRGPPKSD